MLPPACHPSFDPPLWRATLKLVKRTEPGTVVVPFPVHDPGEESVSTGAMRILGALREAGFSGRILVQEQDSPVRQSVKEELREAIAAGGYDAAIVPPTCTVVPGWACSTEVIEESDPPGIRALETAVRRSENMVMVNTPGTGKMTRTTAGGESFSGIELGHSGGPGGARAGAFAVVYSFSTRADSYLLPIVGNKIHMTRENFISI